MHYHKLRYLFERHVGLGVFDALLKGVCEALNFSYMLLFRFTFRFHT